MSRSENKINAGGFSNWLQNIRAGLAADVPCGECNACCRSSYFIHIKSHEQAALTAIPAAVRFPAPGLDSGDQIMGYDNTGACPMLTQGRCSIYTDRPQTCRDYDCRIFAACGTVAGGAEKAAVNDRVSRWQFEYPHTQDLQDHKAVRDAFNFLQEASDLFPKDVLPQNPTQTALLAIACYDLFLPDSLLDHKTTVQKIVAKVQAKR
jgi:uncharacterized protein